MSGLASIPASRGFTLTELLISLALVTALAGLLFEYAVPAFGIVEAQPEAADMQQRLRVGVEVLRAALLSAGAGSDTDEEPITRALAPITPYRQGARDHDPDRGIFYRADTISLVSVSAGAAQTVVRDDGMPPAADLPVAPQASCPPFSPLCRFSAGQRLLVLDETGGGEAFTLDAVDEGTGRLVPREPLRIPHLPGARIVAADTETFSLKADPATNAYQVTHYDGARTERPILDHVVALAFRYTGRPDAPRLVSDGSRTTYGPAPPPIDRDDPSDTWGAGENCVIRIDGGRQVPRLADLGASGALVSLSLDILTDGPWCPDAVHPWRFDADLLRVARIGVTLRVEVASAVLRGPAGVFFGLAGRSVGGPRYVPDLEVRFDAAPRNLVVDR